MAIDRGTIDKQLQALGDSARWWDQRELRDLPSVMNEGERILAIARGKLARVRWLRRSWLIVATDRRLLCLRSGGPTKWQQVEVDAGQITRVALRVGPLRGRVVVVAGGNTYRLLVPRPDSYKLSDALSRLSTHSRDALSVPGPTLVVRRVFDHVLSLPAAVLNPAPPLALVKTPPPETAMLDERVAQLEEQVQELQRQVTFLEDLLRERHAATGVMDDLHSS